MLKPPHAKYWEGILQLRNPSEKLINFVADTTEKDQKAVFTKIKKLKNGFDYWITSQKYLQQLGKKIKEKFNGEYKLSSTLHTQNKDRKRLYRITIFFREYSYKRGDIVDIRGDDYKVLQMKNKIYCQEVKSGKKKWIEADMIRKK